MKFVLEHVCKTGERAAHLDIRNKVFSTPFPLIATKGGAIPHLTRETLAFMNSGESAILLPFQYHSTQKDVLLKYEKGLANFMGLGESVNVLTIQDPSTQTPSGYHGNKNVSVWINSNREIVDDKSYADFVRVAKPDLVVQLCDGDTSKTASLKRVGKATKKSLQFLDSFLALKETDCDMQDYPVVAAVEGGFDANARQFSAKEVAKRPVNGFLIDGFHSNGPDAETLCWQEVRELFTDAVNLLPKQKPKFYFGPANPSLVFKLLCVGVDVFDTSYPNMVTERESALIFKNTFIGKGNPISEFSEPVAVEQTKMSSEKSLFEVDMRADTHKLAMVPLVCGCCCYTCRNFTASYVHHLVVTGEMLAKVLLTLHNLHHYQRFFQSMREAITCDSVDQFCQTVLLNAEPPHS